MSWNMSHKWKGSIVGSSKLFLLVFFKKKKNFKRYSITHLWPNWIKLNIFCHLYKYVALKRESTPKDEVYLKSIFDKTISIASVEYFLSLRHCECSQLRICCYFYIFALSIFHKLINGWNLMTWGGQTNASPF